VPGDGDSPADRAQSSYSPTASSSVRQPLTSSPPGRSARASRSTTAGPVPGARKIITLPAATTRWKACSSSSAARSPSRQVSSGARSRATASIEPSLSTPVTS
jgi:hypothetical protein